MSRVLGRVYFQKSKQENLWSDSGLRVSIQFAVAKTFFHDAIAKKNFLRKKNFPARSVAVEWKQAKKNLGNIELFLSRDSPSLAVIYSSPSEVK
jgi:hypothetical protein